MPWYAPEHIAIFGRPVAWRATSVAQVHTSEPFLANTIQSANGVIDTRCSASSTHTGPGAFYALMPHNAMAALFGAAFLYAIVALAMGVRAFWRDIGEPIGMRADAPSLWQAMKDAAGKANDAQRMQLWAGQAAAMAPAEPAAEFVQRLWTDARALLP